MKVYELVSESVSSFATALAVPMTEPSAPPLKRKRNKKKSPAGPTNQVEVNIGNKPAELTVQRALTPKPRGDLVNLPKPKAAKQVNVPVVKPSTSGASSVVEHVGDKSSQPSGMGSHSPFGDSSTDSLLAVEYDVGGKLQKGWSGLVTSQLSMNLSSSKITEIQTNTNADCSGLVRHFKGLKIVPIANDDFIGLNGVQDSVSITCYALSNLVFDYMTKLYASRNKKNAHVHCFNWDPFEGSSAFRSFHGPVVDGVATKGRGIKEYDEEHWIKDPVALPANSHDDVLLFDVAVEPFHAVHVWAYGVLSRGFEDPIGTTCGFVYGMKPYQRADKFEVLDVLFRNRRVVFLVSDNYPNSITRFEKAITIPVGKNAVSAYLMSKVVDVDKSVLTKLGPVYNICDDGSVDQIISVNLCTEIYYRCVGINPYEGDDYHATYTYVDAFNNRVVIDVEATSPLVSEMLCNVGFISNDAPPKTVAKQMLNKALIREKARFGEVIDMTLLSELTVAAGLAARLHVKQQQILDALASGSDEPSCLYRFFCRISHPDHILAPGMTGMSRRRVILWRVFVAFALLCVALAVGLYFGLAALPNKGRRLGTGSLDWLVILLLLPMCLVLMRLCYVRNSSFGKVERIVQGRTCLDPSQMNINVSKLNRNVKMLRVDSVINGLINPVGDLSRLPCQPKFAPPCVQKGPAANLCSVGFHQCARTTLNGVFLRTLVESAAPDPIVLDEFFKFVRGECFPEALACLDRFNFSYQDWFQHLEGSAKPEVDKEFSYYVFGRDKPTPLSRSFVKIDEKHDMSAKLARPRVIVAAPPSKKPFEGPFFYALEKAFDHFRLQGVDLGIPGYCGSKNWDQLGQSVTDAWHNIYDPCFVCYDISSFDASQHGEIMKVTDQEFYGLVLENQFVNGQLIGHYGSSYPELVRSVTNYTTQAYADGYINGENKVLVEWRSDGIVPSGRNNTTEGNTRRSAWYFKYACFKAAIPKNNYRFWAKGDDLLAVVSRNNVNNLETVLHSLFAQQPAQTKGLGMLLKRVEVGGVNDFDFLSARAFYNGQRFLLVRDPIRFLNLTPWTISLPKWENTLQCFTIMRDLQWSEYQNITSWVGAMCLPIFSDYAEVLLCYATHSVVKRKVKYRSEIGSYDVLDRKQTSGTYDDQHPFREWLFEKYEITAADIDEFSTLCRGEIVRVSLGLGDWEYCGNYKIPVPLPPFEFKNCILDKLFPNGCVFDRLLPLDVCTRHVKSYPTRNLVNIV